MLQILSKRSSTADKRPDPANLANGELAVNFNDASSNVFYKNSAGGLDVVGAASYGATAPNASPAGYSGNSLGEFWYDTSASALKLWNGSGWTSVGGGSGTVTSITAGSGLTGGTITTSGTIALDDSGVVAGTYSNSCVVVDSFGRVTSASSGCSPVLLCTVTSKGGLIAATGNAAVSQLSVGTNGQFLVADSACATGLKWATSGVAAATPTVAGIVFGCTTVSNTALGCNALLSITSGVSNTATGVCALRSNTSGGENTATGACALRNNTTGGSNTAHGREALFCNTTGGYNTASGADALRYNTTGSANTAVGKSSLFSNTTGFDNTASGHNSLLYNTEGCYNTSSGVNSLKGNTTGSYNTAFGVNTLLFNTTGLDNTAIGFCSLYVNSTGIGNVGVGSNTLSSTTTGVLNLGIGVSAGSTISTGSCNVAIGPGVQVASGTADCQLSIGYADGANWITGNSTKAIKPGAGIIDCADSTGTAGQVLMSNGSNAICWGTAGGGSGTVTSIIAGTGLTGGTITTSGTIALDSACVIAPTIFTAKGSLISASAASTPVALPVGTDGQYLIADSLCATGLKWSAITGAVVGVTGTSPISVDNTDPANPVVEVATATTSVYGVTLLEDTVTCTSSAIAATANAVRQTYDVASQALTDASLAVPNASYTALGDILSGTGSGAYAAVALGTNGYVLTADSTCAAGVKWAAGGGGGSGTVTSITAGSGLTGGTITTSGTIALDATCVVDPAILTAKGSILSASAASTPAALPVGTNGQYLVADSACATGLKWFTLAAGVAGVTGTAPISVDNTDPLNPIISVTSSSTIASGVVQLATDAEVQTGSNTTHAVTPSGLQSKVSDSVATTSSTTIASSTAVKTAFDAAETAQVTADAAQVDATQALTDASAAQSTADAAVPNSSYTAKGTILAASAVSTPSALPVGTDGQYLVADSTCTTGLKWETESFLNDSLMTAKGAIVAATALNTPGSLSVGADGEVLIADSACATGLKWGAGGGGGGGVTSITAGAGLTGGTITTTGTIALDTTCVISPAIFPAKGSILVACAGSNPAILCLGSNGQYLVADNTTTTGLKWESTNFLSCSLMTAKGTIVAASALNVPASLSVGADGQFLVADSTCTTGLKWATECFLDDSIISAKGTLITGTAASTPVALPVGTNGQILLACSTCSSGLAWVDTTPLFPAIPCSTLTAKGQLLTATAASTPAVLDAGTNGQVLVANSACSTGLQYQSGAIGGWTDAGTIQSVGLGATTTAPTINSTSKNNVSYRQLGPKEWEVAYTLTATSTLTAGSGDYLFTLPNSLAFDTTLHWQPIFTGSVGVAAYTNRLYFLAGPSCSQIIFTDNNTSSSYGAAPVIYYSTLFRFFTTASTEERPRAVGKDKVRQHGGVPSSADP